MGINDDFFNRGNAKYRKPVTSGLKSQVLIRSRGRCERCHKAVISLGLKPRYHHKDGNPSHNTISNVVLLCNDCHDKVHEYRKKTCTDSWGFKTTKRVMVAKRIKKRGRKKRIKRKKSSSYHYEKSMWDGHRIKVKNNPFGL